MGIIVQQSIRNTIVSYLGVALGFVLTILLYPQILSAEQYGLTRVLLSLAVVSTQLASLGSQNTIIRYFPLFRDRETGHRGSLFLSLVVPFVGFVLLAIALYAFESEIIRYFSQRSELLTDYYWLILPLAFSILFFHVLSSYVRALYDTVLSSFLMNVLVRILTIAILVAYFLGWITFDQFLVAFVVNYGMIMLLLFAYTLNEFDVSLKPHFSFLRKSLLKSMGNYSFFAFLGGVATVALSNIDIIMLGLLAGLEDTGIYAVAFYIGSAITIPRRAIYQISSPLISDAFKTKDYGLIENVYRQSSLNMIIVGGLIFCGVIGNLDNLMSILPPEYAAGATVIIIIAAANVFDVATGINGAIILNSKHYRFDLYSTLFLMIITIILNLLLIPAYGIVGAAIGTASALLIYNSIKVVFVWLKFSMQPFESKIIYVVFIGGAALLLNTQIPLILNTYADIVLRSVLITALYLIPIIRLQISAKFNTLVFDSIDRITKAFKR